MITGLGINELNSEFFVHTSLCLIFARKIVWLVLIIYFPEHLIILTLYYSPADMMGMDASSQSLLVCCSVFTLLPQLFTHPLSHYLCYL
jgi:hypothetical protein